MSDRHCEADYSFAGRSVRVRAADPGIISEVDGVIGACRAPSCGGRADIVFTMLKEDGRTFPDYVGHEWASYPAIGAPLHESSIFRLWSHGGPWRRLDVGPGQAQVWCDLERSQVFARLSPGSLDHPGLVGHYVFFPSLVQLLKAGGLFQLHAAAVSLDGLALILAGPSGSGKSTLALNLVSRGLQLLNDDTVFLYADGAVAVRSYPEQIKISKASAAVFPELGFLWSDGAQDERKRCFRIEEVFPGSVHNGSAVPTSIVFPSFTGKRATRISSMSAAEALAALLRLSLFVVDPFARDAHLGLLARLVEQAHCYRAEIGSDNEMSACALRTLLNEEWIDEKEFERA